MDDEDPDEHDGGPARCGLRRPLVGVLCYDDGDDDVAGGHADGPDREHWFPPDAIDPQHGGDCGEEHGDAHDAGRQQAGCVAAQAERHEDARSLWYVSH